MRLGHLPGCLSHSPRGAAEHEPDALADPQEPLGGGGPWATNRSVKWTHTSWKEKGETLQKKPIIPPDQTTKYDRWHFSPAIDSGGFLFVSGCTGTRPDGTNSEDAGEQFRQAFENVKMSLIEAGLTFSDVVEMTSFHVGLQQHFQEFIRIKDEFVGEPYPAWTAIGVSELVADGAVIEIKITAAFRGR
jgi:enamine deaminase RidA (YjgF/YER057c/UK114 family)